MAARSPRFPRRRRRPGSLERPLNERTYRGTWLLVGIPLLIAAFSVRTPQSLPRPPLPPSFDGSRAVVLAGELATLHPDRRPGSSGAREAARWVSDQFRRQGFEAQVDRFRAQVPGFGTASLENVLVEVTGRSPEAIVVVAHRDNRGDGPGANDNASGTAALVELARVYAEPATAAAPEPVRTIIFLSSDGGAYGGAGVERFAESAAYRDRIAAVVNLDAVAGRGPVRIRFAGDAPRTAPGVLVRTAAARVLEQTGEQPGAPSLVAQLIDLGFPFSLHEHAPFVGRRVPALTLTTLADDARSSVTDAPEKLWGRRLAQLGGAAESMLVSLDGGLELAAGTPSALFIGSRVVPGWAVQLVLIATLLPFVVSAVDLFARSRRRGIPLGPAWRSLRTRLGFWTWVALVFGLFALLGLWPDAGPRPLPPESPAASDWPVLALCGFGLLSLLGWLLARQRLLPRRTPAGDEALAGHTVAVLTLAIVSFLVVALNPFALIFILPSLHAWLWLAQLRGRPLPLRASVFLAGLLGPLLLLGSFAGRIGMGLDAPWYLTALAASNHVPIALLISAIPWLAAGGQLGALAVDRYAPYPGARERPPRGPLRELVRRLVLASRSRRRRSHSGDELAEL